MLCGTRYINKEERLQEKKDITTAEGYIVDRIKTVEVENEIANREIGEMSWFNSSLREQIKKMDEELQESKKALDKKCKEICDLQDFLLGVEDMVEKLGLKTKVKRGKTSANYYLIDKDKHVFEVGWYSFFVVNCVLERKKKK